jgi:hypothetical protein
MQSPPWWLAGGIPRTACLAAYQPKGASSLAGSYTNLATPGVNNAALGVAPTWDVENGWKFNTSQYLRSGIIPATNYSIIIRFSNMTSFASSLYIFGSYDYSLSYLYGIQPAHVKATGPPILYDVWYFAGGGTGKTAAPEATSGTLAMAGLNAYRNGILDCTLPSGNKPNYQIDINGLNRNGSNVARINVYYQAIAIYGIDISPYISRLNAAINAL